MDETPKSPMRDSKPPKGLQDGEVSPWALAGLGMQLCVSILLFVWVGGWLDRRLGTAPLFLLGGVLVGGGGTFYLSYRRLTSPRNSHHHTNDSTPKS
jgi:hypothetical protein